MRQNYSVKELEPMWGNMYKAHALMLSSGAIWRCKHRKPCMIAGFRQSCFRCWLRYHIERFTARHIVK